MAKAKQVTVWVNLEVRPDHEYEQVVLKGAWDDWQGSVMRKRKDGTFYTRKKLPVGSWECGFECDGHAWVINPDYETKASPYGTLNNLVSVEADQ